MLNELFLPRRKKKREKEKKSATLSKEWRTTAFYVVTEFNYVLGFIFQNGAERTARYLESRYWIDVR